MLAYVRSGYPWLDEHIKSSIRRYLPDAVLIENLDQVSDSETALFQFCDGRHCNFTIPLQNPQMSLINMYPNADALTRKDRLSMVVSYWVAKQTESILKSHVPKTIQLNLDYAWNLEYALDEADSYELCQSLEANSRKRPSAREWWILKPAMTDCAYGIRLFSTMTELSNCLELTESPGEDTEDMELGSSKLRRYVAQTYITSTQLLRQKKFHIRAYTLAIGRLQVFVYREMLLLLASEDYRQPWDGATVKSSLTNTAIQGEHDTIASILSFWSIPEDELTTLWKEDVFGQICDISAEVFRAASRTMASGFVALPGCCELFALDFLADANGSIWLLEVNSGPAFYHEGQAGALAVRLFDSVIRMMTRTLSNQIYGEPGTDEVMVEVMKEDLGRSNIREVW